MGADSVTGYEWTWMQFQLFTNNATNRGKNHGEVHQKYHIYNNSILNLEVD